MELAVSISGTDSQHLTSHDHLHVDSQDYSSLHQFAHEQSPAPGTRQTRNSSPTSRTASGQDTMSSSNVATAPTSTTPTSPFHRRVSATNNAFEHVNALDIEGQNHDRMETDEESSDDSSLEPDTPQDGSTTPAAGPTDMTMVDLEAMDTAPDRPESEENRQAAGISKSILWCGLDCFLGI